MDSSLRSLAPEPQLPDKMRLKCNTNSGQTEISQQILPLRFPDGSDHFFVIPSTFPLKPKTVGSYCQSSLRELNLFCTNYQSDKMIMNKTSPLKHRIITYAVSQHISDLKK